CVVAPRSVAEGRAPDRPESRLCVLPSAEAAGHARQQGGRGKRELRRRDRRQWRGARAVAQQRQRAGLSRAMTDAAVTSETEQQPPLPSAEKPLAGRKILIIVENLPVPFDRRVWQESLALVAAGAEVSVICP